MDGKIYVAGHNGMVGSALVRSLHGGLNPVVVRSHQELDLRSQSAVFDFFRQELPDYVFLAAAKVGGIWANMTYPADFMHDNLLIQTNVMHSTFACCTKKLLFLGSSCMYPRDCQQPMCENDLLTGKPESTNDAYVLAKLAGMTLCQAYRKQYNCNFITVIPPNLYGPNDTYNQNSHVISALIKKFHDAKHNHDPSVVCWGDGSARREFMYVEDFARAAIFVMKNYNEASPLNIGTGVDISIKELAEMIAGIVGYAGNITWDVLQPSGMPRKVMDISKFETLGWPVTPITLEDGIRLAYFDYQQRYCR